MDIQTPEMYGYEGIKRVLISREEIQNEVKKTGQLLTREYAGKRLLVAGILKGSFVFMADLVREIKIPCEIDFLAAKSYGDGTVSSGTVEITRDIGRDISEYHLVLVEDIIDTGRTLLEIKKLLSEREPLSLSVVALLDKPERRAVEFKADHALFTIPDVFAVGYGLDCGERFRNLPYIAEASL